MWRRRRGRDWFRGRCWIRLVRIPQSVPPATQPFGRFSQQLISPVSGPTPALGDLRGEVIPPVTHLAVSMRVRVDAIVDVRHGNLVKSTPMMCLPSTRQTTGPSWIRSARCQHRRPCLVRGLDAASRGSRCGRHPAIPP